MDKLFRQEAFEGFSVRSANIEDTDQVLKLLQDVALWLQEKGVDQWGYLREGGEDEEIRQDIAAGTTYIVKDADGSIAATFNLAPKQNSWDMDMWGERNDAAIYLHRLAVGRNYRHKQIGWKLLHWIEENLDFTGDLRLDCVASNAVLNQFYQDAGFTFVGFVGSGENKFSTYEKVLVAKS